MTLRRPSGTAARQAALGVTTCVPEYSAGDILPIYATKQSCSSIYVNISIDFDNYLKMSRLLGYLSSKKKR